MAVFTSLSAFCADTPPDLTGAKADQFKAHIGKVICLTGRLETGMQGFQLFGSNSNKVRFYIRYDASTNSVWDQLMHKHVRVTGELRLNAPRAPEQIPVDAQRDFDYYYMVKERTTVESVECK
jgi:hypothetical protein